MEAEAIRILIADDHAVVRRGLALVLCQEADFTVVAEACNGEEAVELAAEHGPNLALLDWKMPRLDGLTAAREIKSRGGAVRTLVLSGAPVESAALEAALEAMNEGVDGFVHKDVSPAGLAHAIRVVAAGKTYLGPEIAQALLERDRQEEAAADASFTPLSPREMEVLQLMATPATYREIGERLFVSEETVRTHVKRIFTKLGQPNRTQAVIAALKFDLIKLD
ncbi:MAG: response regulator transcription factor [Candidatus Promineifilaceae bacterium]|nr:response regulator transcription factor [Candidatus Promineifilaceae bacterium]